MAPLLQHSHHERAVQDFLAFVRDHSQPGLRASSLDANDENPAFLPYTDLERYLGDSDQLNELLRAVLPFTGPTPVAQSTLRDSYARIFAILIIIDQGHYIGNFVKHDGLSDQRLPFDQKPQHFPISEPDFFDAFYRNQWRFCAPLLTYRRIPEWEPLRILPFTRRTVIDGGGSSTTYQVDVHEAYDRLNFKSAGLGPQGSLTPRAYVLKTFDARNGGDKEQLKNEVEAFIILRNAVKPEPCLIGFYGGFEQGGSFNIILEYADAGTLEDFFCKYRIPFHGSGIHNFWSSLLPLIRAIKNIHEITYDHGILGGWHQDVKPQNVLVCMRNGRYTFKLADLGLSHFRLKRGEYLMGRDAQGTRTYGAPECYRADDASKRSIINVTPTVDVWSMGCILSEAATWLVHTGYPGLGAYRQSRIEETEKLPSFSDIGCFHNGTEALDCVNRHHDDLKKHVRTTIDPITGPIVDMIDEMLCPAYARAGADHLWVKSHKLLKEHAQQMCNDKQRSGSTVDFTDDVETQRSSRAVGSIETTDTDDSVQPVVLPDLEDGPNVAAVPNSDSGYGSANAHADSRDSHQHTSAIPHSSEEQVITTEPNVGGQRRVSQQDDDFRSLYSVGTIGTVYQEHISHFADDLFEGLQRRKNYSPSAMRLLNQHLPRLLRSFALRLQQQKTDDDVRRLTVLIRKYREDISAAISYIISRSDELRSLEAVAVGADGRHDTSHYLANIRQWQERVALEGSDSLTDDSIDTDYENAPNGDAGRFDSQQDYPYKELLHEKEAYQWLLHRLDRQLTLTSENVESMEDIGRFLRVNLFALPALRGVISDRRIQPQFQLTFALDWDIHAFWRSQSYDEDFEIAIQGAIVLIGSAQHAQATTCVEYLELMWPAVGVSLLRLLLKVSLGRGDSLSGCSLPDETKVYATSVGRHLSVEATGTETSLIEVAELLCWLSAALRCSPYEIDLALCKPRISAVLLQSPQVGSVIRATCTVDHNISRLSPNNNIPLHTGACWQRLFANHIVVGGFPILRRPDAQPGLEMSFPLMAALARTKRVVLFGNKTLLKGHSTMLVPTSQRSGVIMWHVLDTDGDVRIPYTDHRVGHIIDLSVRINDLEHARHIIGWSPQVHNVTGRLGACYEIRNSGLEQPPSQFALEKFSISAGKWVSVGVTMALGKRDKPVMLRNRDDYMSQLMYISRQYVIMYDTLHQRGYLLDGASVLLHLVRASLQYDLLGDFKDTFTIRGHEEIHEGEDAQTAREAAIKALTNQANHNIKIYPNPEEIKYERTADSLSEEQVKITRSFYTFKDRVDDIAHVMGMIFDHQTEVEHEDGFGFRVRATPRKLLVGFDFKDVAANANRIRPRCTILEQRGQGWVDLAREINAVTLFGEGFGELIRPLNREQICGSCADLPRGQSSLAVCVSDLHAIMSAMEVSPSFEPLRLTRNLIWHQPSNCDPFVACEGPQTAGPIRCPERVQVLCPRGLPWANRLRGPGKLPERGAVIFGHSTIFPLRWLGKGFPQRGEYDAFPASGENAAFEDSGLGTSIGTSSNVGTRGLLLSGSDNSGNSVRSTRGSQQAWAMTPEVQGQMTAVPTSRFPLSMLPKNGTGHQEVKSRSLVKNILRPRPRKPRSDRANTSTQSTADPSSG